MPFLETGAAARCGCVLSNEYRMPAIRCLRAVLARACRCETLADDVACMGGQLFTLADRDVVAVASRQAEAGAEPGLSEAVEERFVHGAAGQCAARTGGSRCGLRLPAKYFIIQSTMKNILEQLQTRSMMAAAGLGILGDLLVRVAGRPGLNVALWALAGVVALALLARHRQSGIARESKALVAGAVLFAFLLLCRDAEALAVFSLFGAILLLGMAAGRGAQAWARRGSLADFAAAAVRTGGLVLIGPFGWGIGAARGTATIPADRRAWSHRARSAARGIAMALPPLLILAALLASADPVFEGVLRSALFKGVEPLLDHVLFAGLLAWLTSGFLRAFSIDDVVLNRVSVPRPGISPAEITIALSLLDVLFLAFMMVQLRYLFGGADLVEVTRGLTYADYARRGFFELVAATVFAVPLLLIADWAASDEDMRGRRALRATSTLLVLLLIGVLASAAFRMRLYQNAYGLTEDRVYGSAFMVWLALVLAWLALTVLRGERRRFAFGAIVAGLACIVALHVLNPQALIARTNIERAAAGAQVDARYLSSLSADAAPALIQRLPDLPVAERCRVATTLKKNWRGESPDWRTWNVSDARARRLVAGMPAPAGCVAVNGK